MAHHKITHEISSNHVEISIHANGVEPKPSQEGKESNIDYSQRAWLDAALLGANDGMVSAASVMMAVGASKENVKAMLHAGFACLITGPLWIAIGELKVATQIKRDKDDRGELGQKDKLPHPFQVTLVSMLAFLVGATVALLAVAMTGRNRHLRLGVLAAMVSLSLLVFGWVGATLGKTPFIKSFVRVLVGGLMAVALTFVLTAYFSWLDRQYQ